MVELNYKEFGNKDNDTLIILHGLFGSLDNWQTLARKFGETYHVFTIDQRNHGKSIHTEEHSYELMAEDLNSFLEQQGLDQVFIIGHSMGGKTLLQFMIDFPHKLKKGICVDMSYKEYQSGHDVIFDALKSVPVEKIESRNDADKILSEKISHAGIRQFLLKNIDRTNNGSYKWKMNLKALDNHYDSILKSIIPPIPVNLPILFIKGEKSDYLQMDDIDDIKTYFPLAEIENVKNAGHWIHAEQPESFYKIVIEYLKK